MANNAHDTRSWGRAHGVPENPCEPQDSWLTETDRHLAELDADLWSTESIDELDRQFLSAAVAALAAVGAAIWTRNENAWRRRRIVDWPSNEIAEPTPGSAHAQLLTNASEGRRPCLIPPRAAAEEGSVAGNETEYTRILVPFGGGTSSECILEVLRPPNAGPTLQRGFLRLAARLGKLMHEHERYVRLRELPDRFQWWQELEPFVRNVFASMDRQRTATVLAEQGRSILRCDRLTVMTINESGCLRAEACCESSSEDLPSDLRRLGQLAEQAWLSAQPLWYHGRTHHWPPSIVPLLDAYLDCVPLSVLGLVPLITDTHTDQAGKRRGSNIDTHPFSPSPERCHLSGGAAFAHKGHQLSGHRSHCSAPSSRGPADRWEGSQLGCGRSEHIGERDLMDALAGKVPSPHWALPASTGEPANSRSDRPPLAATIFGLLVIEKEAMDRDSGGIMARAESVAEHGGRALWHAIEHERALRSVPTPFWRRLGSILNKTS